MSVSRRPMRYCHTEGHTDVCFSDDGKYIVTSGNDGDIRVWCGLEDDDPNSQCVGEAAFAVAFKGETLFVATDNNKVQAYTFPQLEKDGIICNFTAPVTQIVISNNGKKVICGSRDMTIQICEMSSNNYETLSGHSAPILGVSVDPELKYLASSSCDGTIRIWSLETLKCVHIWSCLPECNSFKVAKCLGRTSWFPTNGKFIAVPDNTSIDLYKKDSWEKIKSFTDARILKPISIALFSCCGKYLAGSTISGEICIWNINQTMCVSYTEHPRHYTITAMAWNPANNGTIAFCDAAGQLGTIEGNLSLEAIEENVLEDEQSCPQPIDEEDDDDDENAISLDKIKSSVSQPCLGMQKFDIDSHSVKDDDDDDDDDASKMSAPTLKLQCPFQPASSPDHLEHRYMAWNSVGIIRSFSTTEENSVEVEFHDSSLHHALRLNNFLNHTLASLSEKAVLLACGARDTSPSKMVCVLLNSWDGSREWSVELPEGEVALAIACATNWVAVATNIRNLRFFTIAGAQREVLSLPGPIVCLAAQSNMLLVAYHHGLGLSFTLLSVERHGVEALVPFQPMPLSPHATLQWAGFSDEGTPCTVDSVGILRILSPKSFWLPLCDTRAKCKGKSDNYFVIGLSEKYQNVRCILCKGSHYPQTTPRPTVVEIPLKIPFCEISSEKSGLEEEFWRTQAIFDAVDSMCKVDMSYQREKEKAEKTIKETFIKLFALACRNGLEQRALDICRMMPSTQVVQLAIKYASKLGKMQLVERMSDMCDQITCGQTGQLTESHSRFIPSNKFSFHKKEAIKGNKNKSDDEDPFASQESSTGKENILLALKDKINSPANTPPSSIQKKVNPFKKNVKVVDSSANTEVNGGKDVAIGGKAPNGATSSSTLKVKQTGLWGKSPNSAGLSAKRPTFPQWFEKEKSALQEEFPDLDSRALSSVAVKRFKEVVLKKGSGAKPKDNSPNLSDYSQNSLSGSPQNTEDDITQSLLIANLQTDATEEITTPSISNTETKFEIAPDAKKRKLNDSSNPGGSFASKLAKFTFKK